MAAESGDVEGMVVTGLRRSVRMVAPAKASLDVEFSGWRDGDSRPLESTNSGRRSFAASQSSSTN